MHVNTDVHSLANNTYQRRVVDCGKQNKYYCVYMANICVCVWSLEAANDHFYGTAHTNNENMNNINMDQLFVWFESKQVWKQSRTYN